MVYPTHRALLRTVAALFAIVTVVSVADLAHAQEADGVLNKNTVNVDIEAEPIIDLDVVFEPTAIAPTGLAFNDPLDPQFTGDLDAILAANSLTRFDVFDVLFDRVFDGSTEVTETSVVFSTEPGTLFIGEPRTDPCNVIVVIGQLDITITNTTIHTNFYTDTLTIRLFADAAPHTIPTPAALPGALAMRRRR